MTTKKQFFKSGIMLACVALLMRGVSLAFNAHITEKVGAEGMGLLSLTMSVYGFAVTFATAGVALAVTRLVAAALGRCEGERARRTMRAAVIYALCFGGAASLFLYFGSDFIALKLLSDIRTRASLRLLSVSLVPIALSAVHSGYFIAVRRVSHNAVTQVFEQCMRIFLTFGGLAICGDDVEYACLALVGGSSLAELFSFFLLFLQARIDMARHRLAGGASGGEGKAFWGYAFPCAVSAMLRSGLVTVQHLLIPYALGLGGAGRTEALASYAALHSMALPVVLFPTAVLASFSGLLVPECAELESQNNTQKLTRLCEKALFGALAFASLAATVLFLGAEDFGMMIYQNDEAGRYIRALAPLVPVMYLDSVVDAHLKGLGYQVYSMGVNIADAAASVLGVLLLLPRFGADGYIYVIYITELLNFALSLGKLLRLVRLKKRIRLWIAPPLAAIGATLAASFLLPGEGGGHLALCFAVGILMYAVLLLTVTPSAQKCKKTDANSRNHAFFTRRKKREER